MQNFCNVFDHVKKMYLEFIIFFFVVLCLHHLNKMQHSSINKILKTRNIEKIYIYLFIFFFNISIYD